MGLPQILQHVGGPLHGAAANPRVPQGGDLFAHRTLIARQVVRELGDLRGHQAGETGDSAEGDQDDRHDGKHSRHPEALQQAAQWREDEAEEDR
jgi:hypothetical protein